MSTNKTQNYQLHAWGLADELPLEEVNENFAKLDAALKAEETVRATTVNAVKISVPELVLGTYTGNAELSSGGSQSIVLGFRPKWVLVIPRNGKLDATGGLIWEGRPATTGSGEDDQWCGRLTDTGLEVRNSYGHMNYSARVYYFLACK